MNNLEVKRKIATQGTRVDYYLMYFSLHEVLSPRINKHIWEAAMKYLKETDDDAGWHVMMYGA